MMSILYIAIIIIDVMVIMDVLKGNKDGEKKVLWIVAVIFLPLLGPLLYWFMGRK